MRKNLFMFVILALIVVAPNVVSAKEPATDLEGTISPEQSWVLHIGEVWCLPLDVTDLKIAPVRDTVNVEIERAEVTIATETDIPKDNSDITDRRIKPMDGDVYLWSTAGAYQIVGWAPLAGVAVVKTGPLGQGGPPPPGNVTPTPTGVPPTPTLTPLPPEPTPAVVTVEEVAQQMMSEVVPAVISVLKVDQGFLEATKGDKGDPGEPGTGLSVTEVAATLKTDADFIASLKGEKGDPGGPGVPADVKAVADTLKGDPEFMTNLPRGEPGPPGDVPNSFFRVLLGTLFVALVSLAISIVGWWVNRPDTLWAKVNEILDTLPEWKEALERRDQELDKLEALAKDHGDWIERARTLLRDLEAALRERVMKSDFEQLAKTRVIKVEFEAIVEGLLKKIEELEVEIDPLRPREVTLDSAGNPRCPGCSAFAKRIPPGMAGRCSKCGIAYVIPAPEPAEEVAVEEAEVS